MRVTDFTDLQKRFIIFFLIEYKRELDVTGTENEHVEYRFVASWFGQSRQRGAVNHHNNTSDFMYASPANTHRYR